MTDPNISTKDRPGQYDAFETAKPGEPIFTLQGGDPLAPLCVMVWAWKARQLARRVDDEKEAERLLRKAAMAEGVAWAMQDYQRGEAVAEAGAERAGAGIDPERISERAALIAGVGRLNNAVGVAKEVEELLDRIEQFPEARRCIVSAIDAMKAAANLIEPRRGNERT